MSLISTAAGISVTAGSAQKHTSNYTCQQKLVSLLYSDEIMVTN